jgi:hypothetical protein
MPLIASQGYRNEEQPVPPPALELPPGHPEMLVPERPLTEAERPIWNDLLDIV